MVYDAKSATDNSTINKVFIDNQMYPMVRQDSVNYSQGMGQMVAGLKYINVVDVYGDILIDDLKMWNHKLSDGEIVALSNWIDHLMNKFQMFDLPLLLIMR